MVYKIQLLESNYDMSSNKNPSKVKGYTLNLMFGFIILGLSVLFSTPTVLIPQHNAVLYPEYWYEVMISASTVNSLGLVLNTMLEYKIIFKEDEFSSLKCFLSFFIVAALGVILPFTSCYLIWTVWLRYNNPMPFVGFCYYISYFAHLFQLWLMFPVKERKSKRKRIKAYFLYRFWFLVISLQNMALRMVFNKLPINTQWIMGFVLPLVREMNTWILTRFLEKSTESDKTVAKLITTISINVVHAFFVAIIISSMANQLTSFCILGVDLLLNLYACCKITKITHKIEALSSENFDTLQSIKSETMNLFAIEAIEVFIPFILVLTFLLAYYGPNGEILGGIRNSYWHFKEIYDIGFIISELALMFSIDLLGLLLISLILYKCCKTDFFYEGYKIMKIYWPIMAIKIGGKISQVSTILRIALGSYTIFSLPI